MSIPFWFSFLFAAPPHNACTTQGMPLLEMRDRSETSTASTTTKIFESGAWTVRANGRTESGCFDRKELRAIRSAVQHAQWKVTTSPIACFAYDPNFTEYYVHGKLRFTEQMCSGKTADFETMKAIDLVKKELADDRTPIPSPTPLPPPPAATCNPSGQPLFEIRHRSELAKPTSTAAIYSNGAWTYQPIDKDGHLGALTSGCFDKKTTMTVRDLINKSPWDTTLSRIVCKAYSPSFTEYYVHGQLEYTARLCGAQRLDEKSLGALEIIERELAAVLPKA